MLNVVLSRDNPEIISGKLKCMNGTIISLTDKGISFTLDKVTACLTSLSNAAILPFSATINRLIFFVGDIRDIDATNSTVTAELACNDLDNTILAGNGNSSLWGGNLGNDLLVGGERKNTFYYTFENGNDTIKIFPFQASESLSNPI